MDKVIEVEPAEAKVEMLEPVVVTVRPWVPNLTN